MYGELPHTGIGAMLLTTVAVGVWLVTAGVRLIRRAARM